MDSWPRGRARDGGVDELVLPAGAEGTAGTAGRLWLAGKHAVAPNPDRLLVTMGASGIVCLNQRHELIERYPEYVEWLLRERGRRAIWFPIPDLGAPPVAEALTLVVELRDRLRAGEAWVVHCGAGIGRAGTIAACVLVAMGETEADALAGVATQRPMAGPEGGGQRRLVTEVSEQLRLAPRELRSS